MALFELHSAWACHECDQISTKVLITPCGCVYHTKCLPSHCILHGLATDLAKEVETPQKKLETRRDLLRTIQANGLAGKKVSEILLDALWSDLVHLKERGLIIFSPHQSTVFDAHLVCPVKDK